MGGARDIATRLRAQLDPTRRTAGLSPLNRLLVGAIVVSVVLTVIETEPAIASGRETLFRAAELAFGVLFAAEYGARLWLAGHGEGSRWAQRLSWMISPAALLDLAALLPMLVLPGTPAAMLRILRLLRIVRLARLGRFSAAWTLIADAVKARRYELGLSFGAALIAMLLAVSLLYVVESPSQPEAFGSIPRALWWAVMTFTTIGYGDVYPQSSLGKALTGVFAVIGIGLIAAPTGILAAAFSDAWQARTSRSGSEQSRETN